ncbi:MAG: two component transcriptional regulator, winged helix family [Thermomicrobiales bacterium]|nr:two component transcriptional regulator, winged helix family [Thermomicrobiales bacterium]
MSVSSGNGALSHNEMTILVVEDEEEIRDLVATALRFRGFGVVEAGSGGEALGLARTANPHLIVLDVMLPARPRRVHPLPQDPRGGGRGAGHLSHGA